MTLGLNKHVDLTDGIIAACFEVHNVLGPGLEEHFYRDALIIELEMRGLSALRGRSTVWSIRDDRLACTVSTSL